MVDDGTPGLEWIGFRTSNNTVFPLYDNRKLKLRVVVCPERFPFQRVQKYRPSLQRLVFELGP